MANIRLGWNNLIDASGVVLTKSSENADLPVANVLNELRTKPWRTGVTDTTEWVVFDFGSAKSVEACALISHTLTAGDSNINVQGNATDSWGAPTFDQALTWRAGIISAFFAAQSFRYFRVEFDKSASGETRDIGRIFLGPYDDIPSSGFSINPVDKSVMGRSVGGQTYHDIRPQYDELDITFTLITKAKTDLLKTMIDTVGQHKSVIVSLDDDVEPEDWLYYAKIKNLRPLTPSSAMKSTTNWDTTLSLEEQL